jgi:CRP-like cAMP-binding protein
LLTDGVLAMTMVARTPVTAALVPRRAVLAILAAQPQHWREIGRMATEHAYLSIAMAADLMISDSRERCAATLLRLCGCRMGPPTGPAEIAVTQLELAAMASLSRGSIGPIVKNLVKSGFITVGYRKITIVDVPALQAIANAD